MKFLSLLIFSFAVIVSCARASQRQLNLYTWSSYVFQDVLKEFEKRTGIYVNYDTYDSNQTLLEKLRSGTVECDVVCPTNWLLNTLVKLQLVESLDASHLPKLIYLMKKFQNPAANAYLDPKILNNSARYPDDATLARCEWSIDQPEVDKVKDRYWTEIKSR